MTYREILARDWGAAACDYRARLHLFQREMALPIHEAKLYAKMRWDALPETLKDAIESWYIRATDSERRGKL